MQTQAETQSPFPEEQPIIKLEFRPEYLRSMHEHNQLIMQICQEILLLSADLIECALNENDKGFFQDLRQTLQDIMHYNKTGLSHDLSMEAAAEAGVREHYLDRKRRKMLITWLRGCKQKVDKMVNKTIAYINDLTGYKIPKVCMETENTLGILPKIQYDPCKRPARPEYYGQKFTVVTTRAAVWRVIKTNARAIRTLRTMHERLRCLDAAETCPHDIIKGIYSRMTPMIIALEQDNLLIDKMCYETYGHPFCYSEEVETIVETVVPKLKHATNENIQAGNYNKSMLARVISYSKNTYAIATTATAYTYMLYKDLIEGGAELVYYDPKIKKYIRKLKVPPKQEPPTGYAYSSESASQGKKPKVFPRVSMLCEVLNLPAILQATLTSLQGELATQQSMLPRDSLLRLTAAPWRVIAGPRKQLGRAIKQRDDNLDYRVASLPCNDGNWLITVISRILTTLCHGYIRPIRV